MASYAADVDPFLRLLDDARADERSAARIRERLLRQAAEEGASLGGTLLDLAESGAPVTIRTTVGRTFTGVLELVADDFVVVGSDCWLATVAVATVRPGPGAGAAAGDRAAADLTLLDALALVAADRPRAAFVVEGGDTVAGELLAVGSDVVTVRLDGAGVTYVSSAAIRAVLRSG